MMAIDDDFSLRATFKKVNILVNFDNGGVLSRQEGESHVLLM